MNYLELFGKRKPIIAMLHLKSDRKLQMLERAKKEIEIYYHNGIEAVLVENYFGSDEDCETVLAYLQKTYPDKIYGVNILGDYKKAFELANQYGAKLIQIDSVCGHLEPRSDKKYAKALNRLRQASEALVLGGVRFKYQPICSGRTLEADLLLGKDRCDALVVTGEGTGRQTPKEKMDYFREKLDNFPLITGAGVTLENLEEALAVTNGIIIGSWIKTDHAAEGEVCEEYVQALQQKFNQITAK